MNNNHAMQTRWTLNQSFVFLVDFFKKIAFEEILQKNI
jgi:hypothetical protein